MKNYLILYDISQNKERNQVVKLLKKSGFYRIQKSVFLGATTTKHLSRIIDYFSQLARQNKYSNNSYIIIPIPDYLLDHITEINIETDFKLFCNKKTVHFF